MVSPIAENTTQDLPLAEGQWTSGIIARITPIGIIVRLNDSTEGLLFKDEIFRELIKGEQVKVYIKKIREDGKIDLALTKGGYKNIIDTSTERILSELTTAGGFLPFTDKSNPDDITDKFEMSKKKFKEAIGALYRERKIVIADDGIRLVKP